MRVRRVLPPGETRSHPMVRVRRARPDRSPELPEWPNSTAACVRSPSCSTAAPMSDRSASDGRSLRAPSNGCCRCVGVANAERGTPNSAPMEVERPALPWPSPQAGGGAGRASHAGSSPNYCSVRATQRCENDSRDHE
jgi:hypothetical protein